MQLDDAPWGVLLDVGLPFGAVRDWSPDDMMRLRGVSNVMRGEDTTAQFLCNVLNQGLGVNMHADTAFLMGPKRVLLIVRFIYAERVMLAEIPRTIAKVMGLPAQDVSCTVLPPLAQTAIGCSALRAAVECCVDRSPDRSACRATCCVTSNFWGALLRRKHLSTLAWTRWAGLQTTSTASSRTGVRTTRA